MSRIFDEAGLDARLYDKRIGWEHVKDFIESEIKKERVRFAIAELEKAMPDLVCNIARDMARHLIENHSFQDGRSWGLKMVREKITEQIKKLEDSKSHE